MAKATIPVYDICSIDQGARKDLLVDRFAEYLERHYQNLHTPHRHSFYHLVLFTRGSGWHTIDFEKFPVRPYQIYFMVPGQVHSWHFKGDVDGYILHFDEVLLTSFLRESHYLESFSFFRGISGQCVCQLPATVHERVTALFEDMLLFFGNPEKQLNDLFRLRLLELLMVTAQSCAGPKPTSAPQQKVVTLRSFRELIEKHFRSIRLPKEYADLLYITPNHLNALTKDLVGKSAGDLIRDRVVLEAKRLLTNADMTVAGIAYDLNFPDSSYFNRFFKKYVGSTPDQFRKSFKD